ncbi:hypothetical protein QAD02_019280 [Eretmocerus hayati]|uniref:Uncharacterized protein n=1 Tax=Eretmocerus hayati TaxID=131215 RepID=A0ACC2PKA6_9HYME|nr:hypothetical protein QAD02_019280 [Eretmocerus hayati]
MWLRYSGDWHLVYSNKIDLLEIVAPSKSKITNSVPSISTPCGNVIQAEYTPENSRKSLPESLKECYDGDTYAKWNLLPQSIETLIAIIRKIEESREISYQSLRQLTPGLLHRFRQDGIVRDPRVIAKDGIIPYAPNGEQFYRHSQLLRMIPQNAFVFPNNSISAVERCSLHHMISSSIDIYERDNERTLCKSNNGYGYNQYGRRPSQIQKRNVRDDVEVLSPEKLSLLQDEKTIDPSSQYPFLSAKDRATRFVDSPVSQCPAENGVMKTRWGTVSAGSVLAGIASSLESQSISISTFLTRHQSGQPVFDYPRNTVLDSKMFATLAGDLAEVALIQGAQRNGDYTIGTTGNWNSSDQPLYYLLDGNENLQMTAAEIRGGIDGLILANYVPTYNARYNNLKLSQILDMYYSQRGFFNSDVKACKRSKQKSVVITREVLASQAYSSAILLANSGLATSTLSSEIVERFTTEATTKLMNVMQRIGQDSDCSSDEYTYENLAAIDLTIVLDTDWPYDEIIRVLWQLLQNLEINKFNSNFTLMSGADGSFIINSTWNHLELANLTRSKYEQLRAPGYGFNLARTIDKLENYQREKLNRERKIKWAGGKSDIILIAPYTKSPPAEDREYLYDRFMSMHENVPDAEILFLTSSRDAWSYFVLKPETDIITYYMVDQTESNPAIDLLQARMKQVPRRIINTQCGADYRSKDRSEKLVDAIGPKSRNFYRIHPNYFHTTSDSRPKIKIQTNNVLQFKLRVCTARELMHPGNVDVSSKYCQDITNSYEIQLDCEDSTYIHDCKPVYFYIESNMANNSNSIPSATCTDITKCRFLNDVSYTIYLENLVCTSGQNMLLATPVLLILVLSRFFL